MSSGKRNASDENLAMESLLGQLWVGFFTVCILTLFPAGARWIALVLKTGGNLNTNLKSRKSEAGEFRFLGSSDGRNSYSKSLFRGSTQPTQ